MIKLRTFLILSFTAFVILLTSMLSLIMSKHSTQEIQDEIGHSLSGIAYQMSNKLDYFMWSRAGEMEMMVKLDAVQQTNNVTGIQKMLDQLQKSFPCFSWVGFLDTRGNVLAATDEILVGTNISARPVFKEGIKGRFIGDVHEAVLLAKLLPNPTGEPLQFVDISMPVKGADGQTIGVLAAHLSWEWSKEVQRTILKPQQDYSKNLELFIVSKTDNTVLLGPQDMIGHPLLLDSIQQAQTGNNGWELVRWPDGKSYLTGYAYGEGYLDYKGLGWTVLVRQPEEVAFSSVDELRKYFIMTGTIACILFALIGWFLADKISRPIRGLTVAADRLRAGEHINIPEYTGFQEIFILTHSLKSLVESLGKTESALGSMRSIAHSDQLTGLPNRVALEEYLEQTLHQMNLHSETLAFMYLDLDGFKKSKRYPRSPTR
ncbi:cache domain-containing protein [Paenibacillus sp. RC67]|uniref:sensor domain-containing diguanylate cyclase n=1 Tax=Paenibacillus sp. RC67 TaxID=3039392 RepID=UPI0032C23917